MSGVAKLSPRRLVSVGISCWGGSSSIMVVVCSCFCCSCCFYKVSWLVTFSVSFS
jgi:hypothetical protein